MDMCGIFDLIAECWRSVTEQFFRSFDVQLERYNGDREYRDLLEDARTRWSSIYLEPRPIIKNPRMTTRNSTGLNFIFLVS